MTSTQVSHFHTIVDFRYSTQFLIFISIPGNLVTQFTFAANMFSTIAILTTLLGTTLAAPISLSASTNWATNVIMTAGSAQFAMWVPTDGNAYSTSSMTCLNVGASSTGSCAIASIDQVGVLDGYTCAFEGGNGWSGSQEGTSSSGWIKVAPPQTIASVACISN